MATSCPPLGCLNQSSELRMLEMVFFEASGRLDTWGGVYFTWLQTPSCNTSPCNTGGDQPPFNAFVALHVTNKNLKKRSGGKFAETCFALLLPTLHFVDKALGIFRFETTYLELHTH
eukprot:9988336-Heterocapsa_arctica.AAC.1